MQCLENVFVDFSLDFRYNDIDAYHQSFTTVDISVKLKLEINYENSTPQRCDS